MIVPYFSVVVITCVIATFITGKRNVALFYLCALTFLPDSVHFVAGSVNMWGSDILSLIIFMIVMIRGGFSSPFKFHFVDTLLPFVAIYRGVCLLATGEEMGTAVQGGVRWFIPWVIPYFIARMGVRTWDGFKKVITAWLITAVILSGLSMVEAYTGRNALAQLGIGWNPYEVKFGLWRSHGPFNSMHIFGMFLANMSVLSLALYCASTKTKRIYLPIFIVTALGAFSTTASTGWMQAIIGACFMIFYRFRQYWKIWVYGFLAANIFVHFASSNGLHFFYARRLGALGEAYYRAKLIDDVLAIMPGHWLFGHGTSMINIWFVSYEDICNHWLLFLVKAGTPGFLALVVFYALMLWRLKECYGVLEGYPGERVFLWGILSVLFSLTVSWFFIALYGSDIAVFSSFFGLVVSLPDLARYSQSGGAREMIEER